MNRFKLLLALLLVCLAVAGCTRFKAALAGKNRKADQNQSRVDDSVRGLVTGTTDALAVSKRDPPADLALRLSRKTQEAVGLPGPTNRIDVAAVLAQEPDAAAKLERLLADTDRLLVERIEIARELSEARGKLIELGERYEAERNKSIVRRVWGSLVGTLGLAGAVAVLLFCPALIPVATHALGAIVGAVPKLAGALGVVGKNAFDAVVVGVEKIKQRRAEAGDTAFLQAADADLGRAMDQADKDLVKVRKAALTERILKMS